MNREEVMCCLYDRYIKPTKQKKKRCIGVEIELPIVNLNNEAVDFSVVHRLTGDAPGKLLIAPEWTRNKKRVLNTINRKTKNP